MSIGDLLPNPAEIAFNQLQIEVLRARRQLLEAAAWNFDLSSPFWRLYVNNCPTASIHFEGQPHHLQPGTITLIPAWLPFKTQNTESFVQDYIHFEIGGISPSLHCQLFPRLITLSLEGILQPLYEDWVTSMPPMPPLAGPAVPGQPQWLYLNKATAFLHVTLSQALSDHPASERLSHPQQSTELKPALDWLETHLDRPPRNEDLAQLCHLSTEHFIRKFKCATGLPPGKYSLDRRLAEGARLLTRAHISVEKIAEATGFSDRFHFSKAFKTHFGFNPGQYRKAHLQPMTGK